MSVWVFRLHEDWFASLQRPLQGRLEHACVFQDRRGQPWLEVHPDGQIWILKDYAWDGCSPKFVLWDVAWGTPDGVPDPKTALPKTYHASLVHDVLYQFLDDGLPLSRREADQVFLELLTQAKFKPRWVYYGAVRLFGGLYRWIMARQRQYGGRRVPLSPEASAHSRYSRSIRCG